MNNTSYTEDDLLQLSALQHYIFCPRQCALIHIEQQWVENRLTAEGRIMHERVHSEGKESRGETRVVFGVALRSMKLGVVGKADVVEFHITDAKKINIFDAALAAEHRKGKSYYWVPFPVEYKRGKPKQDSSDKVQLCAQAICLEELTGLEVPAGALFYGKKRKRQPVSFDQNLRWETETTARQLHELIASGRTPLPVYSKKCESCSFIDVCLPEAISKQGQVENYYAAMLKP
jgi:CRISPR-associated exonuclease Cas4